MKFRFGDAKLQRLYTDTAADGGYAPGIGPTFRRRIQTIDAAIDERTFYSLKSLRFEKLKGQRDHQYSMRLNDRWRLVLELEGKGKDKIVALISIEDYH
ncbi:MAG TPA: type II toxin-antitoxin system RelE/ParE family toxin [Thermoanaerobaculia bacterium]|nr:type II toxin-antitoxin system RelE/ParE family toxin [Thermoanaerobaculia bacterium]